MSLVLSIIVWYTSTFEPSSANFNCISRQSVTSGTTDGAQINVNCTSSPYLTLVSCGTRTHDPTTSITDGSWIVGDSCFAQNGERGSTGQGVYAVARCCDFTHVPDLSCVALMSAFATGNDGKSSITCGSSTHQFLTGCTVRSPYTTIDGSYPGTINPHTQTRTADSDYSLNGYCTAVNGQTGDGTKGNLMCCASPSNALQCVIRYGSQSDGDKDSRATCGSGYAMTSCSGYGAWLSLNAWYISGDTCIARTYSASQYVYAIAICCKLETDSPTLDPTQSPTLNPTANPSANPSQSPTANPSSIPTKLITSNPTEAPSGNPTKTPTDNPTISPTSYPTSDPTTSPTDNPTISPTSDPTKSPIRNPSANPSRSPTDNPTSDPITQKPTQSPTDNPTSDPLRNTQNPTQSPTDNPTADPTKPPTVNPSYAPSSNPADNPSTTPTSGSASAQCAEGEYACEGSTECINVSKMCDGYTDCPNAEDEVYDVCINNGGIPVTCGQSYTGSILDNSDPLVYLFMTPSSGMIKISDQHNRQQIIPLRIRSETRKNQHNRQQIIPLQIRSETRKTCHAENQVEGALQLCQASYDVYDCHFDSYPDPCTDCSVGNKPIILQTIGPIFETNVSPNTLYWFHYFTSSSGDYKFTVECGSVLECGTTMPTSTDSPVRAPSSVPPTIEPSTTSTDSPPSTLEPTLSPTDPCDVLSAVDFDDPCSPDPGTGCGVLIKLDATVCVINGLVTRSRLERSIVRSVKTIVNGLDELDVVCTEDKIYLKDVQVEPSREADADVARANGSHKPENESECPKVDELCGDEQNDEPQFDVDIVVAIRCDLSCDVLRDIA
eukprot:720190_1